MKNKVTVNHLNAQYSEITVTKNGEIKKHIVPNHGWLPLSYWVEKFEKEIQ